MKYNSPNEHIGGHHVFGRFLCCVAVAIFLSACVTVSSMEFKPKTPVQTIALLAPKDPEKYILLTHAANVRMALGAIGALATRTSSDFEAKVLEGFSERNLKLSSELISALRAELERD